MKRALTGLIPVSRATFERYVAATVDVLDELQAIDKEHTAMEQGIIDQIAMLQDARTTIKQQSNEESKKGYQ